MLGLVVGPFLAGLTLRVPAGEGIVTRRGWLGEPAGTARVAVVTGLAAVVLGLVGAAIGAEPELPAFLWLGAVGVALAVIDVDCFRLPDRLTLPSYGMGFLLLAAAAAVERAPGSLVRAVLASVVAGGLALLLALVAPGGAFGLGDVKLLGLLGLHLGWLGWGHLAVGIALGFLIGAAAAVTLLVLRRAGLKDSIPFGQWLIAGALVAVVAGRPLLDAYLGVGAAG
jgi:leader peptidase (prepilin peptidase)/N-methyltransferase